MKLLIIHPLLLYAGSTFICLIIMIIIDYFLGAEAEHLNAWVIINRLVGRDIEIGDSLAIRHFGLIGATIVMLAANTACGILLVQAGKMIYRFIQP